MLKELAEDAPIDHRLAGPRSRLGGRGSFTGHVALETPDDLPLRLAFGGPAADVLDAGLVEPHADDDAAIEGGVGLAMPSATQPMAARGHAGRGRHRAGPTELGERLL